MQSKLSEEEQKNEQDKYSIKKESDLIFINFFDIDPNTFIILNPYNLDNALKSIENITEQQYKNNYLNDYFKKDFEFKEYEEDINFSIDNISFLSSTLLDNNDPILKHSSKIIKMQELYFAFISLVNFDKNNLIVKQNINIALNENEMEEIYDTGINFKLMNKDEGKKEIIIKCSVNAEILEKNIVDNLINKSPFHKAKTTFERILKFRKELELNKKKVNNIFVNELDIKIPVNSLNGIIYSKKKGLYLLDLQHPPSFRSNFLIDPDNITSHNKNDNSNIYYENIIFPFRNFEDEISNLKYRHFFILVEKNERNINDKRKNYFSSGINDTNEEFSRILGLLFKNYKDEIDTNKFIYQEEIPCFEENEFKKLRQYKKENYELSNYFKYDSNEEIKNKFEELNFIKKEETSKENPNLDNTSEEKEKIPLDENLIKLYYQILALISEGILSYYNAIEFVENIIYNKNKNYKETIFKESTIEDFPLLFNLSLEKLLDKYQNSLQEKTISKFESDLSSTFTSVYKQYLIKSTKDIINPSKNSFLIPVQRCTITPTFILFSPYALAQGNRILREFLSTPVLAMLCSYKMEDFKEGRWNNQILIEYIKYIMSTGFNLGEKKYRFFNFSQSQFRNKACWLLTEPEKILRKTGNYTKIRNVAKFGARVSQNLTTTVKTIKISGKNIVKINDVKIESKIKINNKEKKIKYVFSDGVGKISYDLAKEISKILKLKDGVPSCFQGRFQGCKGVWTTMFDDLEGNIYIRPSQDKFIYKSKNDEYFFELCDYSRYIQAYLNRQIILLLNCLGIKNEVFIKKLERYEKKLKSEKFVLSLVHYSEWNSLFQKMYKYGINKTNDRLIKSLIESNLNLLYNDIKNKARIYIEDSAYVMGIMDEFGILEYGQAFLHIKRKNKDLILNQKCSIAKCPCLHPGDIRILDFKKYIPGNKETEKYKIFEKYENVIIFPSKGKRPHPNECSGSDLDGDYYFIFYDKDLIPKESDLIPPMNYFFDIKSQEKRNIKINDIIEYFAEYTNLNNLGLIGDAHLALADLDKKGAKGALPMHLAEIFSQAVDAPKTGLKIELNENENAKKFPHYMGKKKNKSYISKNILGLIYDNINENIALMSNDQEIIGIFYDKHLEIDGWKKYALLALVFYRDYYKEMTNLLIKNEIKGESILLTGNNIDNEDSIFTKRKHNYDLREKITEDMRCLFDQYIFCFKHAINIFFSIKNILSPLLLRLNEDIIFNNNLHLFASACYMIAYNFGLDVINKENSVRIYGNKFLELFIDNSCYNKSDNENSEECQIYESDLLGNDLYEIKEFIIEDLYEENNNKIEMIKDIINKNVEDMELFVKETKEIGKIPKQADEENQYRILSFPWCISGDILTSIKFLNNNF